MPCGNSFWVKLQNPKPCVPCAGLPSLSLQPQELLGCARDVLSQSCYLGIYGWNKTSGKIMGLAPSWQRKTASYPISTALRGSQGCPCPHPSSDGLRVIPDPRSRDREWGHPTAGCRMGAAPSTTDGAQQGLQGQAEPKNPTWTSREDSKCPEEEKIQGLCPQAFEFRGNRPHQT